VESSKGTKLKPTQPNKVIEWHNKNNNAKSITFRYKIIVGVCSIGQELPHKSSVGRVEVVEKGPFLSL
jgi:hypothetical protein